MNNINISNIVYWMPQPSYVVAGGVLIATLLAKKVFSAWNQPPRSLHTPYFPYPLVIHDAVRETQLLSLDMTCYRLGTRLPITEEQLAEIDAREHRLCLHPAKIAEKLEKAFDRALRQQASDEVHSSFARQNPSTSMKLWWVNADDVSAVCTQGDRASMEDSFSIFGEISAVFDGHGPEFEKMREEKSPGAVAAEKIKDVLMTLLDKKIEEIAGDVAMWNMLKLAFVEASRSYSGLGGTTANVIIRQGDFLWVANTGDSRALAVYEEGVFQLSLDDKLSEKRVEKRVHNRGGRIYDFFGRRVEGALIMGASLGDHYLRGRVSARPGIVKWKIPESQVFTVQASDGLFDVATTNEVGQYVWKRAGEGETLENIAKELVALALNAGSTDNITVLIRRI